MIIVNSLLLIFLASIILYWSHLLFICKKISVYLNSIKASNINHYKFYLFFLGTVILNIFLLDKGFNYLQLKQNESLFLHLFISVIFYLRFHADKDTDFKEILIQELKTLIENITSNLEKSQSIDTAVRDCFSKSKSKILKTDIIVFSKLHNYNIQNEIVSFFKSIAIKYKINELQKYLQLLNLELRYNKSPVIVFQEISQHLNSQEANRKQFNNQYKLINFSIDFMLLFYYLNLLIFIPQINLNASEWLSDSNKNLGIIISTICFWAIYLVSHLFLNHKRKELF